MLRILVLTFYYPPDLCAGSFRAAGLMDQLTKMLPPDARIDVLTSQPNRYSGFRQEAPEREVIGNLTIERIALPPHHSGMLGQANAFLFFDLGVRRVLKGRRYDLVFATSSRLMTAHLAARVSRRLNAPLYLDIRDIFADAIHDVIPGIRGRLLGSLFNALERHTFRQATRVNLISEGFRPYFAERYPQFCPDFFTNGIDDEFLTPDWSQAPAHPEGPVKILYAGNIGEGQGLHRILPQLAGLLGDRYQFIVVGEGGRKAELQSALANGPSNAVRILPPVGRQELLGFYQEADILFIHLNDYDAFRKVLPSKVFEYAATGKPILAGVAGHAAAFLTDHVENCRTFTPCSAVSAQSALQALKLEFTPRTHFRERFARAAIMKRMAGSVLEVAMRARPGA